MWCRVVLEPDRLFAGKDNIMTKRQKRHSPEEIVRKLQTADRLTVEGK